jgi:succinoglycan biosynthesis transport protein ExoP
VLLRHDNFAGILTGVPETGGTEDAARVSQTQADLARVPPLAQRVIRATDAQMTAAELLETSSVTPKTNSDLLTFSVESGEPTLATRLATAYAREYTIYRRELDTAAIDRARAEAEGRIAELGAAGDTQSGLYSTLVEKVQLLNTMSALQTSNAYLVRPADAAGQISPRPVRNMALALALALILGVGLAFLRETLDMRIRSAEEIGARLGLPLLARLPEPPRRVRSKNHLVTVDEPNSPNAEAFRVLRTNLDFVNLDRHARMIMLTSAVEGEGKSTTAANLAVTLARSGRRVLLVDLDTRRPFVHTFFGLPREDGLTQVALGQIPLDSALTRVAITQPSGNGLLHGSGNGAGTVDGVLEVLTSGPMPPNPGEFAASAALADILQTLRERADIVLVDAPPLLHIGDALALSSRVDALLLITRLHTLRRSMLVELRRVLDACPAAKLGFILDDAELEQGNGYGAYSTYHAPKELKETQQVS